MTPKELLACAQRICRDADRMEVISSIHNVDNDTSTEMLHVVLKHRRTKESRDLKIRVSGL